MQPTRQSLYQRATDRISYAQGTPANLTFWLLAVGLWFAFGPEVARATFIPSWASSNAWNFPLNTGTSCLELFIGFLVSASTNRSERNLEITLGRIEAQEEAISAQEAQIAAVEESLRAEIQTNTDLTQQVHALVTLVHGLVAQLAEARQGSPGE